MKTVEEKLAILFNDYWQVTMTVEELVNVFVSNGVTIQECGMDCKNCWKTKIVNPVQEWVSVDERLPEESGDYLVIANSGSIFRYYYSHEELEFGEYVEIELDFVEKPDTVWISLDTITHWMPIPDLPKGVQ